RRICSSAVRRSSVQPFNRSTVPPFHRSTVPPSTVPPFHRSTVPPFRRSTVPPLPRRPLQPRPASVARHEIHHAALSESNHLPPRRRLHAIDQPTAAVDHIVN